MSKISLRLIEEVRHQVTPHCDGLLVTHLVVLAQANQKVDYRRNLRLRKLLPHGDKSFNFSLVSCLLLLTECLCQIVSIFLLSDLAL